MHNYKIERKFPMFSIKQTGTDNKCVTMYMLTYIIVIYYIVRIYVRCNAHTNKHGRN